MSSLRPPLSSYQRGLSFFLFMVIILFFAIVFFLAIYFTISEEKRNLSLIANKTDFKLRGTIYSSDGFSLASSEKLYKVSIIPQNISPEK